MINNHDNDSIKKCESFIAHYPLFCLLNSNDIHNLALLAKEVSFESGTTIIQEGDIVDAVYLIMSGTAKVTRSITTIGKTEVIPIADLNPGDAIGLTETGFFSHSGIRTATVTATATLTALSLALTDFNDFLKSPGVTYPALKNVGEKIHLMHLLKSAHKFQYLPNEKIKQIVNHLTRISLKSGEYLVKKEEKIDKYYFLLTGKLVVIEDNAKKHIIKQADFLTQFEENLQIPDVYAKSDCELLTITHRDIESLIQTKHALEKAQSTSLLKKLIGFTRKKWK